MIGQTFYLTPKANSVDSKTQDLIEGSRNFLQSVFVDPNVDVDFTIKQSGAGQKVISVIKAKATPYGVREIGEMVTTGNIIVVAQNNTGVDIPSAYIQLNWK
jgi:hypothetical protein